MTSSEGDIFGRLMVKLTKGALSAGQKFWEKTDRRKMGRKRRDDNMFRL